MSNNIPALSMDANDTGDKYLVAATRWQMAQKFGVLAEEYPEGLQERKAFMKMLKSSDPKKYNYWYDIIIREIDPKENLIQEAENIKEQLIDISAIKQKLKSVFDELKMDLNNHHKNILTNGVHDIESVLLNAINQFKDSSRKQIEEELKKIQKVVIEVRTQNSVNLIEEVVHEQFNTVLDLAANRVNILMVGPAGCGKTHLGASIGKALGLPFSSQSCSAGISESVFNGWLLPIAAGGQFEYVESEFVRIYENGGVFLFDEIDAADANVLLFLNQALANSGFHIPQRFKNPFVKKHPDFVAIAAANTYGSGANLMYAGRNVLDGASMDRFRAGIVTMDYSDKIEEATVEADLLKAGRRIRQILKNKKLRKIMSTRFLQDATKMKTHGWTTQKIFGSYFQDWSEQDLASIQGDLRGIL